MKTTEYLNEICYWCEKKYLIPYNRTPRGRTKLETQQYLKCKACKTIQLRRKKENETHTRMPNMWKPDI